MGVLAPGVPVASRPSGTPPLRHRTLHRIDFLKFSCIREAPRAVLIDRLCTLGVNICALESTDRDVALTLRRVVFHNRRPVGWLPFSSCRLLVVKVDAQVDFMLRNSPPLVRRLATTWRHRVEFRVLCS